MLLLAIWFSIKIYQPYMTTDQMYMNSVNIEFAVLAIALFMLIRKENYILAKSIATAIAVYYPFVAITDPFIDYLPAWYHFTEMFIVFIIVLFQIAKKKNISSDAYQRGFVYLMFYKPKTFRDWVISLFGAPYASMGSIIDNKVFRLRHKTSKMCSHDVKVLKLDDYLLINTGVLANTLPENITKQLLKQPARAKNRLYTRTNCVESQKILLDVLPKKWHYTNRWYFIPSVFLLNLLKKLKR